MMLAEGLVDAAAEITSKAVRNAVTAAAWSV
jgi:hypothetical protein